MANPPSPPGIGNRLAPWRFLLFALVATAGMAFGGMALGWRAGVMAGFDAGALVFLLSCLPLLGREAEQMRVAAAGNDANRAVLLGITAAVILVVLVAVAAELSQKAAPKPAAVALVIATLALAWLFSNTVYTLHYAHIFYTRGTDGNDSGGLNFPDTKEPDYWDFVYFAFTLGMTFQTSDTEISSGRLRRIATFHSLAAFVFNIGVLAFTINVLGG